MCAKVRVWVLLRLSFSFNLQFRHFKFGTAKSNVFIVYSFVNVFYVGVITIY